MSPRMRYLMVLLVCAVMACVSGILVGVGLSLPSQLDGHLEFIARPWFFGIGLAMMVASLLGAIVGGSKLYPRSSATPSSF